MAAKTKTRNDHGSILAAPSDAALVTPNDATDLTYTTRGVLVASAGAAKVTMLDGTTLVIPLLAAGIIHPMQVTRIWATGGTTATGFCAFF